MKLSISNIAWVAEQDEAVYAIMKENGFCGLEIAPTRIFPDNPYDNTGAAEWANELKNKYGFMIPSMQSIWFGRQEKIFGSEEERRTLVEYTKKAIDFAVKIGCNNLVFGCPRNRSIPEQDMENKEKNKADAIAFFREIGEYAAKQGTVVGMEANPPIYNTNFVNDTQSALDLIESVGSDGFKLNLDIGTMIQNEENVELLNGKVGLINHVHISEPGLKPIEEREIHKAIREILLKEGYDRYVSIEMGKCDDMGSVEKAVKYVADIFA